MECFGEYTTQMRIRFWLKEIAEQLSIHDITHLFSDDPLRNIDVRKNKYQDEISSLFNGIGRERLDLSKYFNGDTTPRFQNFNNTLSGLGDKFESALPSTKKAFVSGPAELLNIIEASTAREAILCFIRSVGDFFRRYNYIHEHYVPEYEETVYDENLGRAVFTGKVLGGQTAKTDWATISKHELSNDINSNYQNIRGYLPSISDDSEDHKFPSIPEVWFLNIADAFIQVKFFNNSGNIRNRLIIYSDILLDIEKQYHINRKWWFAHPIFEQERELLLRMKEPLFFEKYKIDSYTFDDD
tara:strand:+ start:12133 stop:13029 length:897 start_codon:yes stop_codon:yes gene_type:complete